MTPQEQKELAEFGAEFLGKSIAVINEGYAYIKLKDLSWRCIEQKELPRFFFESVYAPILAHLAKREMEKRGFEWTINWFVNEDDTFKGYGAEFMHLVNAPVHIGKYDMSMPKQSGYAENENEYIALWLAIREAVKDWAGVPEHCKAGAFEKNVQILLGNVPFTTMCDVLREKGINADEIWEAFFRLDAIEAGEVE